MKNEKDFPYYEAFEKQGEDYVRQTFSERDDEVGRSARPWLKMKEVERDLDAASKRDAREERTLKLAEDANTIAVQARSDARAANKIAITAAILAAIATICAAIITVIYAPK